jgi:hypothetical protein
VQTGAKRLQPKVFYRLWAVALCGKEAFLMTAVLVTFAKTKVTAIPRRLSGLVSEVGTSAQANAVMPRRYAYATLHLGLLEKTLTTADAGGTETENFIPLAPIKPNNQNGWTILSLMGSRAGVGRRVRDSQQKPIEIGYKFKADLLPHMWR